jgi:hypothetical protein
MTLSPAAKLALRDALVDHLAIPNPWSVTRAWEIVAIGIYSREYFLGPEKSSWGVGIAREDGVYVFAASFFL